MVETTVRMRRSLYKRLIDFLIKINLFDEQEDVSVDDQLLATRIFLLLLTMSLTTIIVFTGFSVQTHTITVQSPSFRIFLRLSNEYPLTFSCMCTQSSIRQNEFLSFNPEYHPICTSQFMSQTFLSSLSDRNMSNYWPLDYRLMIASHFQMLALLCRIVNQTVLDALEEFGNKYIITNFILSSHAFDAQITALVDHLITTTIATSKYTSDFLWFSISQNGIYSGLRTNYYAQARPGAYNSFFSTSYKSENNTCSCMQTNMCVSHAGIYDWIGRHGVNSSTYYGELTTDPPLLFHIAGLMSGCLPYNSLLKSTLECFYNQSCLDSLQIYIKQLSDVPPLSSSFRFAQNATIADLFDQLFIESWNNVSNFTNYFQICSPHLCTYSYNRRYDLLYIIITIISLFGGLRIILFFCAPFIVKFIRKIQAKTGQVTIYIEVQTEPSLKDRLITFIRESFQQIIKNNMFPYMSKFQDGIYSTRLYIFFLIIGLVVLVFYASLSIYINNVTVYQPSLNQYEQLYNKHSSTLVCPCTHLSMPYSSFMYVQPRYHQVCSSDFVKDNAWLLYSNNQKTAFFALDFRIIGMRLFVILQTLCQMSNKTVNNQLSVFNQTQFVSTHVLTQSTFTIQTSILIEQFQKQTIASYITLFNIVRVALFHNQFIIAGNTNAQLQTTYNNDDRSTRFVSRNDYDNSCSCGLTSACKRSQGFYCTSTGCTDVNAKPNKTIPGLYVNCLPVDSLRLSSLQCFYNESCIQMMIDWASFGTSNYTIDPRVANVIPLDPMMNSRYSPNTTVSDISSQLFIEDWTNLTNFSLYFNQCAPDQCTYTYERRFSTAYIISILCGLVGGLSIALRILIPPVVKFIRVMYNRCFKKQLRTERQTNPNRGLITRFRQYISTRNVYRRAQENSLAEDALSSDELLLIRQQQIATRFYTVLLSISIMIILLYSVFNSQIYTITISSPSESAFELLKTKYSSTLSCPCSQSANHYSKFVSLEISSYHQICSSYFITYSFYSSIWGSDTITSYYWNIDLKILSTQFRLLNALCTITKTALVQEIDKFLSQELFTIETLTQNSFEIQMNFIMQNFILQAPANFRRIHTYFIDMLHANQLHNLFYTNWDLMFSNSYENYLMKTESKQYTINNESCSCVTSSTCYKSLLVNRYQTVNLSGLVIGCLPSYGLYLSKIECLYDAVCLQRLANFAALSKTPNPLNISSSTRFVPISSLTFGILIDELFIEDWQNSSNYSNYFSSCAPLLCQYNHIENISIIYVLTTFLGLYGGLTIGLKVLVWYILSIFWKIRQWLINRSRQIHPAHLN